MDDRENATVQKLTSDDEYLASTAYDLVQQSHETLQRLSEALQVLSAIHNCSSSKTTLTWSMLYIKALSGELAESTLIRELCLSVKKFPSDTMTALLTLLIPIPGLDLSSERSSLSKLTSNAPTKAPLHSEHDLHHSTLRTTVVAQKVSLSKHKAALSKQDTEYSKLVNRIDSKLREYFTAHIVDPKELPLYEVLIFDSKAPCRDALGPAPRQVLERALSNPYDYLACECCEGSEGVAASHPATAILYQLYLESGTIINVADLWEVFQSIVAPDQDPDEQENKEELLYVHESSTEESANVWTGRFFIAA